MSDSGALPQCITCCHRKGTLLGALMSVNTCTPFVGSLTSWEALARNFALRTEKVSCQWWCSAAADTSLSFVSRCLSCCRRSQSRSPVEGRPGAQRRALRRRLAYDEQPDPGAAASLAEPDALIASTQCSSTSRSRAALASGALQHLGTQKGWASDVVLSFRL